MINPKEDGITHINIYSKGVTELGRFLSNFTKCDLDILDDGKFKSIEGYWYWLGTEHPDREKLRTVYGFQAKQLGKEFKKISKVKCSDFEDRIRYAILTKINNSKFDKEFYMSELPFEHYYNYSGKIIDVKDCKWILKFLEELRSQEE